jgi:hypothetical protein
MIGEGMMQITKGKLGAMVKWAALTMLILYVIQGLSGLMVKTPSSRSAHLLHKIMSDSTALDAKNQPNIKVGLVSGVAGCNLWTFEYWRGVDCSAIEVFSDRGNNVSVGNLIKIPLAPCTYIQALPESERRNAIVHFGCEGGGRAFSVKLSVYEVTKRNRPDGGAEFEKSPWAEIKYVMRAR